MGLATAPSLRRHRSTIYVVLACASAPAHPPRSRQHAGPMAPPSCPLRAGNSRRCTLGPPLPGKAPPVIAVTGAAGFIGSVLTAFLRRRGEEVLALDRGKSDRGFPEAEELFHGKPPLRSIFHLGACSSTLEEDEEFLRRNNTEYSQKVFRLAARLGCPPHLRLQRRHLRERGTGLLRRSRPAAPARPAQPLRPLQAQLRPLGTGAEGNPAPLVRPQVLQCLRPERGTQGRDALGGEQNLPANPRLRQGEAVPLPTARGYPTEPRPATSSMWRTPPER